MAAWRYFSRLGLAAAKMLFLTARRIDAAEMLRIGYLDEAVPADALDARVDALAAALVDGAPVAIRGMKRTLNEIARGKLDEAAADARHRASMRSDEVREGVAAYKSKRRPRFGSR
jgi:enoyl-CoA hydratase/carnithine racemase